MAKSLLQKIGLCLVLSLIFALLFIAHSVDRRQKVVVASSQNWTLAGLSERLHRLAWADVSKKTSKDLQKVWRSPSDFASCDPVHKVAFAKTHKTGSSTVQNIFLRYGWNHNLTFVMPEKRSWMFTFKSPFEAKLARTYPSWNRANIFDMFVFHSIWNLAEVRKLVPEGPVLTILRDPVNLFESGYVYMGLQKHYKMDINAFTQSRLLNRAERRPGTVFGRNQLLWDLGTNISILGKKEAVKERIKQLDRQFDLVLIAEKFDESLILMQNVLCWTVQDITYLSLNERTPKAKTTITAKTRSILRKWLWADYMLYNHFRSKLDMILESISKEAFSSRLRAFKSVNDQLRADCVLVKGDNRFLHGKYVMALPIVLGYVVDESKPGCEFYAISEPHFSNMIHDKQAMHKN